MTIRPAYSDCTPHHREAQRLRLNHLAHKKLSRYRRNTLLQALAKPCWFPPDLHAFSAAPAPAPAPAAASTRRIAASVDRTIVSTAYRHYGPRWVDDYCEEMTLRMQLTSLSLADGRLGQRKAPHCLSQRGALDRRTGTMGGTAMLTCARGCVLQHAYCKSKADRQTGKARQSKPMLQRRTAQGSGCRAPRSHTHLFTFRLGSTACLSSSTRLP
ncbi:hypothetical protein BS50DRAFT_93156 [Corynespora cassiicola Philippines]|uniref:Uncharacterized protein n=1 Tax=Corynespora cassiicola Philippines TaxID=1448308 RepID=A0A2T2NFX3_CORCC|nr:hypothetical protein BS50DRAFT_93156 [Corynespora cassiicola Philippines]